MNIYTLDKDKENFINAVKRTAFYKKHIDKLFIDNSPRDIYYTVSTPHTEEDFQVIVELEKQHGIGLCPVFILDEMQKNNLKEI